jgi:hypothetical protein
MVQWLIIAVLYVLGFGLFGLLGGLSSAADAFRSWGEAAAARHERETASS